MATNLLTRRLAGLSLSLGNSLAISRSAGRYAQSNRALSGLLSKGVQESSSAAVPPLVPLTHHAGTRAVAFRWFSSVPAPSTSPEGSTDHDTDIITDSSEIDALISSSRGANRRSSRRLEVDPRVARHGRGFHHNGDVIPPRYRKIKPRIVKRRMTGLKTYIGREKNIRHSPWRMNLICRFVAGMTIPEAENQLRFVRKIKAPLMRKVLKRTANLADIRDGLQPSQLEVAECFATHGHHLKRLRIHARGKSGIVHRRHCHIRLVLREIDFPMKIALATTEGQKRRWMEQMRLADLDAAEAKEERDELAELEEAAAARKAKEEENK